jgi:hypothetical protein
MHGKIPRPVFVVTAILLLYTVLVSLQVQATFTQIIFFASPFLITWMVLSILKAKDKNIELNDNEEWGYADKKRDELGIF